MKSTTIPVRLDAVVFGAEDINLYRFVAESGGALPGASPGSHIDVQISDEFTRSYSLINSGDGLDHYLIGVRRDELGRGGSRHLHDNSVVGRTFLVSPPRNNFELHFNDEPVILLAGGIGITPMVSMYRWLKRLGHPAKLAYWARSQDAFLFRDELERDSDVRLIAAPGKPEPGEDLESVVLGAPVNAHLYCCGPGPMLDQFLELCSDRPHEMVHIERFTALEAPTDGGETSAFSVVLARSNRTLVVGPEDTILQVCLDSGVDVDYSCEEGTCGACESKVIAGQVLHRDAVRSAEEHDSIGSMMICCSRSRGGELVLDL